MGPQYGYSLWLMTLLIVSLNRRCHFKLSSYWCRRGAGRSFCKPIIAFSALLWPRAYIAPSGDSCKTTLNYHHFRLAHSHCLKPDSKVWVGRPAGFENSMKLSLRRHHPPRATTDLCLAWRFRGLKWPFWGVRILKIIVYWGLY